MLVTPVAEEKNIRLRGERKELLTVFADAQMVDTVVRNLILRLFGTYQRTETGDSKIEITSHLFHSSTGTGGPLFNKFKHWIARDILLHEMVHQHLVEAGQMDANERQHPGHGHHVA